MLQLRLSDQRFIADNGVAYIRVLVVYPQFWLYKPGGKEEQ